MKLGYNSDIHTISNSLMETLAEIKKSGETPILKSEMLYKYGRLKFMENEFDEAHKLFGQSNLLLFDNNLPESKEIFYWGARSFEAKGDVVKALSAYKFLLERAKFIGDQIFVDEILDRINVMTKKH